MEKIISVVISACFNNLALWLGFFMSNHFLFLFVFFIFDTNIIKMNLIKTLPVIFLLLAFISCQDDDTSEQEEVPVSVNTEPQYAIEFEKVSSENYDDAQYLTIPNIACPDEFTFEAWVYFKGHEQMWPAIMEWGDDQPFIGLREESDTGDYHFILYDVVIDSNPFPVNTWVHVAASYSSQTQDAKLYINGELVANGNGDDIELTGVGAGIGYNGSDDDFNGLIDEVRVWNTIRTEAEIRDNQNTCFIGDEEHLYAYYTFDDIGNTTVTDHSENAFHGTLINVESEDHWVSNSICE